MPPLTIEIEARSYCDSLYRQAYLPYKHNGTLTDEIRIRLVDESVAKTIAHFKLHSTWTPY